VHEPLGGDGHARISGQESEKQTNENHSIKPSAGINEHGINLHLVSSGRIEKRTVGLRGIDERCFINTPCGCATDVLAHAGSKHYNPLPQNTVPSADPSSHSAQPDIEVVQLGVASVQSPTGFHATIRYGDKLAHAMFDTGAWRTFVCSKWLHAPSRETMRLKVTQRATPLNVQVAGNRIIPVTQECTGVMSWGKIRVSLKANVMDELLNGVDLIIGMDWLRPHDVDLCCGKARVKVTVGDRRHVMDLRPTALTGMERHIEHPTVAAIKQAGVEPLLTAKKAARALRKGALSFLVLVRRKPVSWGGTFMCSPKATHTGSLAAMADPAVRDGLIPEKALSHLLEEYQDIFHDISLDKNKLPETAAFGHVIREVPGSIPQWRKQSRLTQDEEKEVQRQVTDLLERGLVEPSSSPYGAPVLFVKKKDGTLRMCIDYRALNAQTVRDRYPLPNIQDLIDKLYGCTVFSSLDLQSGYHQIRIAEEDVPKTAFITPFGQFQFKVLCFGLTNAPATFQRVMNQIFGKYLITANGTGRTGSTGRTGFVLVFIDDILVCSRSPDEHLEHLRLVFEVLRKHKLYAKLKKCDFNKSELKFLGHIIGREGVAVDPDKISTIVKWPVPKSLQELQGFLGLGNYFRSFVPRYSTLVAPLTDLTRRVRAATFDWAHWNPNGPEMQAFNLLKRMLTHAPVLALPDLNGEFEVHTDASVHGSGGVLMQHGRVNAFTSAKFSKAEYNYTTGEQEFLALIHALKQWRCYLEGAKQVTLVTDHQPLTYLQTQSNLSRRQARWVEFLSRFNWKVEYRPGITNIADPISRNPALTAEPAPAVLAVLQGASTDTVQLCVLTVEGSHTGFRLMLSAVTTRSQSRATAHPAQTEVTVQKLKHADQSAATTPADSHQSNQDQHHAPSGVQPDGGESREAETMDTHAASAHAGRHDALSDNASEPDDAPAHKPSASLMQAIKAAYKSDPRFNDPQYTNGLRLEQGAWMMGGKVVVPNSPLIRHRVMHAMHDDELAGHMGIKRTTELVSRYFWWASLESDVERYVRFCEACQKNKASTQKPYGLLKPLPIPGRRWDDISCDMIVKLPKTASTKVDSILVVVDRLSKMVHLIPCTESLTAKGFAQLILREVIRLHGVPRSILSDRGTQLQNNRFWREVCAELGMKPLLSSAYHPQSDGQTERVNRVIEEVLRSYIRPDMRDWDVKLPAVEFAINNSWHEAIRNTPFNLNYGQHPNTPHTVDLPRIKVPAAHEYASGLERAVQQARSCLREAQARMEADANRKRRGIEYSVGQLVLLSTKNLYEKGTCRKLQPRYMGPFTITRLCGDVAVELNLPPEWTRVHNVFHVSLLKPYHGKASTAGTTNTEGKPGQQQDSVVGPPPVQWLEGEPLYRAERILNHRVAKIGYRKPTVEYLVKWEGYSDEHNTWEPRSNLLTCSELIKAYKTAAGLPITKGDDD
jgi:hypothetical protein